MIIASVRHRGLRRFIEEDDTRGIRTDLVGRIRRILTALILADGMDTFAGFAPPGWRLHRLSGDRKETWSVSVSGNWRITFEEEEIELHVLDLEDYH